MQTMQWEEISLKHLSLQLTLGHFRPSSSQMQQAQKGFLWNNLI